MNTFQITCENAFGMKMCYWLHDSGTPKMMDIMENLKIKHIRVIECHPPIHIRPPTIII